MNREQIKDSWRKYIDDLFKNSISKLPVIFSSPRCATCAYWLLLGGDELRELSIYTPEEYETIRQGIEGKTVRVYKEKGQFVDSYTTYEFYGFCKRYPPSLVDQDSIIRFRSIFSLENVKLPNILLRNAFPVMPHEQWCGEWKQDEWAKGILKEKGHAKQAEY